MTLDVSNLYPGTSNLMCKGIIKAELGPFKHPEPKKTDPFWKKIIGRQSVIKVSKSPFRRTSNLNFLTS